LKDVLLLPKKNRVPVSSIVRIHFMINNKA
jgi:hypothetical protein